jgi:hypothetical protein
MIAAGARHDPVRVIAAVPGVDARLAGRGSPGAQRTRVVVAAQAALRDGAAATRASPAVDNGLAAVFDPVGARRWRR